MAASWWRCPSSTSRCPAVEDGKPEVSVLGAVGSTPHHPIVPSKKAQPASKTAASLSTAPCVSMQPFRARTEKQKTAEGGTGDTPPANSAGLHMNYVHYACKATPQLPIDRREKSVVRARTAGWTGRWNFT